MARTTRVLTLTVIALGLVATLAASALARNTGNKAPLTLTCDGETYGVTIAGNGNWAPARDSDSTIVFHPTAFGQVDRAFYPSDGSPTLTDSEPPHEFQAQQQSGHALVECSFLFDVTYPEGRETATGTVSAWLS
jgi:hypothetical protein